MAGFTIRPACLPRDAAAIGAIDTRFASEQYWRVVQGHDSFRLELTARPRFAKAFGVYDLDRAERPWDEADVAERAGRICGFAASGYQFWNRRHVLWHIYVAPECRRCGIGGALLARVLERAREHNAASVWLETSNLNAPGIAWYRRHGFTFAGLDLALYDGTGASDEVGLFLMRRLEGG